ncbi:MAG: TraB/GumN family protein, partial [Bacteroidales bacterium]
MIHPKSRNKRIFQGVLVFRLLMALLMMLIFNTFTVQAQVEEEENDEVVAAEVSGLKADNVGQNKYPSLMWEITGPGIRKPSYLYGSMHVSRKIAFHLGDTFFMAIKAVDVVALESNPGEWMDNYTNSEYYRKVTTTSTNYLNKYQYRNFYRDAFFPDLPEVKTFSSLLAKRYNVMNHMLYRKNEALSDFEEKTYLDLFIFQAGTKAGKTVIGLEDFEVSREMVREAETPPRKRDPNQKVTREQSKLRYRYGELIEEAYRKGDLDLLDSISRMMDPYPKYHTYMIVKRNEVMAISIDSVIRSGKAIFAACGAAHLPGDSGVIEMLRSMGYTLRPITRTINRSQNKAKDKIDAQVVKLPVKTWLSPDGDFSAELPGPMYSSVLFSNHGEYFFPDMINGSYYVVNRFPTFAPLRGHNVNDVKARFDSLIYEFVPGKINRFRETSVGGFPAYDIIATTSRGDVQQYLLAFTPLEVMVFKMSGPGKYVKKEQASKKFFSSIRLNMASGNSWKPIPQGKLGFTADLPSYRILDTTLVFERTTKDLVFQGFDFTDSSYYLLIRGSFHDFDYIEEDTFELNFMAEQLAEQYDTEVATRSLRFDHDGYPCIDFTMEKENSSHFYRGMITIAGPSYYLLMTTGKNENQHQRFFGSFSIDPPSYKPEDFYTFKDTTLLFEVQTVCDPPENTGSSGSYYWYYGADEEKDK